MTLCLTINVGYLTLLVRTILPEVSLWIKPLNVMSVVSECIKFLGLIGIISGAMTSASIWIEMTHKPGSNFMGNRTVCHFWVTFATFGCFWTIIGSSGQIFLSIFCCPRPLL